MSAMTLAIGMALDAAFGEINWLWRRCPHPVVLMGRLIDLSDRRWNHPPNQRLRGALVAGGLAMIAVGIGLVVSALPFAAIWETLLAAILLAQRSLVSHVSDVASALRQGIDPARTAVARIVGRDTSALGKPAVARAAIESAAENLSDGVIAPAFWFLVCGLPGLLLYKVVNTADSMIGHRTERHEQFGWAAARLDDLLNLLPARLTAVLILLATGNPKRWSAVRRDARLHRSPNAGWPEAAMAIALDLSLSGPRSYHDQMQDYPWVWPEGRRNPGAREVDQAAAILWRSWMIAFASVLALSLL